MGTGVRWRRQTLLQFKHRLDLVGGVMVFFTVQATSTAGDAMNCAKAIVLGNAESGNSGTSHLDCAQQQRFWHQCQRGLQPKGWLRRGNFRRHSSVCLKVPPISGFLPVVALCARRCRDLRSFGSRTGNGSSTRSSTLTMPLERRGRCDTGTREEAETRRRRKCGGRGVVLRARRSVVSQIPRKGIVLSNSIVPPATNSSSTITRMRKQPAWHGLMYYSVVWRYDEVLHSPLWVHDSLNNSDRTTS